MARTEEDIIAEILNESAKKTLDEKLINKKFDEIFKLKSELHKKVYHRLSAKLHPDKNAHPGATEAFKLLGVFRDNLLGTKNSPEAVKKRTEADERDYEKAAREEQEKAEEARREADREERRKRVEEIKKRGEDDLKAKARRDVTELQNNALTTAKRKQAALKKPLSSATTSPLSDCSEFLDKHDGSRALLSYVRVFQKNEESSLAPITQGEILNEIVVQIRSIFGITTKSQPHQISPLTKDELLEIINTKPQNLLQSEHGYAAITELLRASAEKLDLHDLLDLKKSLGDLLNVRRSDRDFNPLYEESCVLEVNKIIAGKLYGILSEYAFAEAGIKMKIQGPSSTARDGRFSEIKFAVPDEVPSALQSLNLTVGLAYTNPTGLFRRLGFNVTQMRANHSLTEPPITFPITDEVVRAVADKQLTRRDDLKLIQHVLLEDGIISNPESVKCSESHSECRYRFKLETGQNQEDFKTRISEVLGINQDLCSIKKGEIEITINKTHSAEILINLEGEKQKLKQCEMLHAFLIEAGIDADAVVFHKDEGGNFICSLKDEEEKSGFLGTHNSHKDREQIRSLFTEPFVVNSENIRKVDEEVQDTHFLDGNHTKKSLDRELTSPEKYQDPSPDSTRRHSAAPAPQASKPSPAAAETPSPSPTCPIKCLGLMDYLKEILGISKNLSNPEVREWKETPSATCKPAGFTRLVEMFRKVVDYFSH